MLCRRTFSSSGAAATAVGDHFGNAAARAGAFAATGIRPCGSHDPRALPNANLLNGFSFDELRAMRLPRGFRSGVIAELRIEVPQCVRGILEILGREILPIAAYFSATHFK
jgi:hypothetical protein